MNRNNFDGLRIGLALIVVFAHLAALTALPEFKWFEGFFDANFAVKGFFAISGFLVTQSYLTSQNVLDYADKRLRRIVPAYLTAVLLCLVIGAFTTTLTLSDFFSAPETIKYVLANAVFLNFLQSSLPGVFDSQPVSAMNGALWTIKIEVMLYACVPLAVYLFRRCGSGWATGLLFLLSVAWVYFFGTLYQGRLGEEIARQFPGQLSYFIVGALFAVNDKVRAQIKWIALASLLVLFAVDHPYARLVIDPLAYSAIVIYLSTAAVRCLKLGRYGDISYGIYLFHFPIIQLLIFTGWFKANPWIGLTMTFALTLAAAFLSWHCIEKRLLKRSSHYVVATQG